jgi:NAD+ kinase
VPPVAFQHIGLTSRSEFVDKEGLLQKIVRICEEAGAEVQIDPLRCSIPELQTCKTFKELSDLDLIIVLGGDGTTLRTVRELKDPRIPLLTINRGTVGFLASLDVTEIESTLPPLLEGKGIIEDRQLLACRVMRDGKEVLQGIALNEIVVSQGAIARLIELSVNVNNEPLTVFRADGLIVASPTGSTAYSLSAGGPIVHPEIPAIVLTPINPHAFAQRPLLIPATKTVDITILPRESKFEHVQVSLTFDGQIHHALERGDHLKCAMHPARVRFLKRKTDSFFSSLREKLGWGE